MIDRILIRKRWKTAIWNCRTYQGADIASDHSLVMCRFRTRLRVNVSNRAQARLDMNALQDPDTKKAFQASLAATLESGAHAEDDIEEHAKFIHEALDNALKEVVPKLKRTKSPWIHQRIRRGRQGTNGTNQRKVYTHTANYVIRLEILLEETRRDGCARNAKTQNTRAVKCTN